MGSWLTNNLDMVRDDPILYISEAESTAWWFFLVQRNTDWKVVCEKICRKAFDFQYKSG